MNFINVTPYLFDDNWGYKKQVDIVLNIDHILWYEKNRDMVKVFMSRGDIYISHTDISRIEHFRNIN